MYDKILVPLDTSVLSEGVLPYVRALARALTMPVQLLCVSDPARLPYTLPSERHEYLQKIAASLSGLSDVTCRVDLGDPAATIVDLAAAEPGSLIAMATHGYSGALRWLLGSVAEKVLRAAKNDMLLVRPQHGDNGSEARLKTVLVPLDGSALAEKVLPIVTQLAIQLNLEVALMRALIRVHFAPPEAVLPVFGAHVPNPNELWASARGEAESYLTVKTEQLHASGVDHISSVLIDGSGEGAEGAIIDLAGKTRHVLIILSSHGRSGIERWIIGSVTERVVRHSSHPVLVIRTRS
jgi:nucleotide-binding universal stress UspA family protein